MISFGETFHKVRECFQDSRIKSGLVPKLQSVTIIRDVAGKIRLFLEPLTENSLQEYNTSVLSDLLSEKLGPYYGNDIWLPTGEQDGYKALIDTIRKERVHAVWPDGSVCPHLYILERHIAKQAWTNSEFGEPPWNYKTVLEKRKPAIVSFFSFKGGVGRTTTLVATALTLAQNGHRVAIVDLDLEAPGLATIFFSDDTNNFGVIDYLLEKNIPKNKRKLDLEEINESSLLGTDGESLKLLRAGTVDENYLEKLARLDFQNLVDGKLQSTIQDMLKELQSAAKPLDFILMDARAGFHDIGGLAIANLSHAVVMFGTQSRQSWAGLTHVIRHLARIDERSSLILVHSMTAPQISSSRTTELKEFREKAYDIFKENYYPEDQDVPNSNDMDEPFSPFDIRYNQDLRGDIALFSRDSTPEDKNRLSELVKIMTDSDYEKIAQKLCLVFGWNLSKNKLNTYE